MKGREAIRTAQRRTAEANQTVERLRAELAQATDKHRREAQDLRDEVTRLQATISREAGRIAAQEVSRRLAEAQEERRRCGLSDDIVMHLAYRKDRLIRNACRYISMIDGVAPPNALAQVLTWCTDKDIRGLPDRVDRLIELGIPHDGWVARVLAREKYWSRTERKSGTNAAISLDHAQEQDHARINPRYNPKWYPEIDYQGIVVVKDEELGEPEIATSGADG